MNFAFLGFTLSERSESKGSLFVRSGKKVLQRQVVLCGRRKLKENVSSLGSRDKTSDF